MKNLPFLNSAPSDVMWLVPVEDVRIATSPKGRLLGFAYVTLADGAEAEAAVRKLRDYVWDGFPVHIRRTEAGGGDGGKNR